MKKRVNFYKRFSMIMSFIILVSLFGFFNQNVNAEGTTEADTIEQDEEVLERSVTDEGENGGVKWAIYDGFYLEVNITGDLEKADGVWPWRSNDRIRYAKVSGYGLTSARMMFLDCPNLESVDLSELDTSKITDMGEMFCVCKRLRSIDFGNIDTSKVTSMIEMFSGCSSLYYIDISGFNIRNVNNVDYMFSGCSSLNIIKLSFSDTSSLYSMQSMFQDCTSLKRVDMSTFNTSNVMNMSNMFYNCTSLKVVDLSSFDTAIVENMEGMFYNCESLHEIDLSNFDCRSENSGGLSFEGCTSLDTIYTPKKLPKQAIQLNGKAYINKSGVLRTEILDANDVYTLIVPVDSVTLNKNNVSLYKGENVSLKATVYPNNASIKDVKWSSSDKTIATVDSSGKVEALAKGTATITVTTVDGSKKATCKITVSEKKPEPEPTVKTIVMYRLYNLNSGEHFYTGSQSEIDTIVAAGWKNEGVAWKAPATSKTPVYRLYNPNAGDHHYTKSSSEKDQLVKVGWKYEGIGWYSDDSEGVALHRLYNPNAVTGSHHYTISSSEKDNLVKVGWKYEGIAWYGR